MTTISILNFLIRIEKKGDLLHHEVQIDWKFLIFKKVLYNSIAVFRILNLVGLQLLSHIKSNEWGSHGIKCKLMNEIL